MVAAFIRKHGVTACPPCGSPELAAFNAQRELEYQRTGGWGWQGRHRRAKLRGIK